MISMPARVQSASRELNEVQDAVADTLRRVVRAPHLDGVHLREVAVGTADTPIAHGLGRLPLGWMLTDVTGDARVWRTGKDKRHLTLRASASVTCDLWVW